MHTRTPQMIEHEQGQLEHDELGRQSQSIKEQTQMSRPDHAHVSACTQCAPAD